MEEFSEDLNIYKPWVDVALSASAAIGVVDAEIVGKRLFAQNSLPKKVGMGVLGATLGYLAADETIFRLGVGLDPSAVQRDIERKQMLHADQHVALRTQVLPQPSDTI